MTDLKIEGLAVASFHLVKKAIRLLSLLGPGEWGNHGHDDGHNHDVVELKRCNDLKNFECFFKENP